MSLGEKLQQARQSAGMSLDDLASLTSIRSGLLREMENNNFVACGGDTYARGHLRSIASKTGADAEELLNLYNEEHSSEHRAIHDLLVENNVATMPVERKGVSIKTLAILSVSALAIAGIAQIVISNSKTTTIPKKIELTPTAAASETATATPIATTTEPPKPSTTPTPPVVTPSANGVSIMVSAVRGNASIEFVVDGQSQGKNKIFQGETKTFSGTKSISFYVSNAGDLDFTVNGRKLAPLGAHNEEVRKTFRAGE
jgi:cytoskeletal protein RodZ